MKTQDILKYLAIGGAAWLVYRYLFGAGGMLAGAGAGPGTTGTHPGPNPAGPSPVAPGPTAPSNPPSTGTPAPGVRVPGPVSNPGTPAPGQSSTMIGLVIDDALLVRLAADPLAVSGWMDTLRRNGLNPQPLRTFDEWNYYRQQTPGLAIADAEQVTGLASRGTRIDPATYQSLTQAELAKGNVVGGLAGLYGRMDYSWLQ